MKKLAISLSFLLFSIGAMSNEKHQIWDALLQKYVSESGIVNYKGFIKEQAKFESYLQELAKETPNESWSRNEQMAYWINAYNAFTVKLIIDNYPLKSILDLKGGKPWDDPFFELNGQAFTLNKIEHEILRPTFKDARIHFAVNCASFSCPKLHNRAYTADNLEDLLNSMAKNFINNPAKNNIAEKNAEISKIFEWYADDFKTEGTLVDFLNKYSTRKLTSTANISYKDYNWELNDK